MDTEHFNREFQVLHLEDNESDHLLLVETLRADGLNCRVTLARSKPEFIEALQRAAYDLIISDYSLPSYDGMKALALAREANSETPFIFFSGTIGEEVAVESLKNGAADYVLKERPGRLVAAVRRALGNAMERVRRKQSERALRESEERFRIVARTTNDVVWEWDIRAKRVWVSDYFAESFGHPVANTWIPAEQWFDYIHPDDQREVMSGLANLIACGNRVWWSEHRLRRADGSHAYIFDRASALYSPGGQPQKMVGVMVDMTERKRAEEKIREQAALLDKATDAIMVCTLEHEITFWNQGAERIYGWSQDEALGKNWRALLFPREWPPQLDDAEKSLAQFGEWKGELQEQTKSGKIVTVNSRNTLIRDAQGAPKSVLIINTDVTEHKQLEEQFLRAQRQESLGSLVSGIAHDLNNALMPISIGVELLKTEPLTPSGMSMLETIEASSLRSSEMVKQMLLFARGGKSSRSPVSPDQLVREMEKIVTDTFPKTVACQVRVEENLRPISVVPTQIHQVLMNLCVNARDAMPLGGTLTLAVAAENLDKQKAAQLAGAREGNFVCFSVRDTGTGISAEQLEKIFQPFFTTKAPGKGTGLGLSTCLGIVKKHDGFITVHSEVGAGTEFKVYLPASAVSVASQTPAAGLGARAKPGRQIMVVDDEEGFLAMTRATLENFGYTVSTAATGMEAITRLRKNPEAISLVIADQIMPLLDGRATVEALRKIRPDLKIIMTSGCSEAEAKTRFENLRLNGFVSKPFPAEKLLAVISQALADSNG